MTYFRFAAVFGIITLGSTAQAEVPRVTTDIPPVHSLVAQVMEGVGVPELILRPGTSPHGYAMRPSEASALDRADIVFWVGSALTPWLDGAIDVLASDAQVVSLLGHDATHRLPIREGVDFGAHDHGHGHEEHDDHDGHEEHDDHDGHEEHDDHDETAGHDGLDNVDPHAWLDPENGKAWVGIIAESLSFADPENADIYFENARRAVAEIDEAAQEISEMLEQDRGKGFLVYHDAYHYFEDRFDFETSGALAFTDGVDPSPARLSALREIILNGNIVCVFSEEQFSTGLIDAIAKGQNIKSVVINPLGVTSSDGEATYAGLLVDLAQKMTDCL